MRTSKGCQEPGGKGKHDAVRLKIPTYKKWLSVLSLSLNGFSLQIIKGLTHEKEYILLGCPRQNKGQLLNFLGVIFLISMVKKAKLFSPHYILGTRYEK